MPGHASPSHHRSSLVAELARRLDRDRPRTPVEPRSRFDLSDAGALIGTDDPAVESGLRELLARPLPADAGAAIGADARAAVSSLFGGGAAATLTRGRTAARAFAADVARARTGRERALCVGPPSGVADPSAVVADPAEAERRLAGGEFACAIVEPLDPEQLDAVRSLCAEARRRGALAVVDESRCAFRLAPGSVHAAHDLGADLVCLGESAACGAAFGAVVALDGACADTAPAQPDPVCAALAAVTVRALVRAPVDRRVAAVGEALRSTFVASCARERLHAELAGHPAALRLAVDGQENAEAPLILHHLKLELERLGVAAGEIVFPGLPLESELDDVRAALDGACKRIRTLLIEHNSYLSGGVDYVFETDCARLAERGLALYRYPGTAAVEVGPVGDAIRISFAAERSETTSSGFYVPTRLRGDFDISIDYRIRAWRPGSDAACLALFVQNELSTARYYAQRSTSGDRHILQAVLAGRVCDGAPSSSPAGSFRLARRGSHLTSWHRSDGEDQWRLLGEERAATVDDVIVGAKIWSLVECVELEADLRDLRIDAEVPADQFPRLEPRADPRRR